MTDVQPLGRAQAREEGGHVEGRELGQEVRGIDAGEVRADGFGERHAVQRGESVEHRAVEQGRAEARDEGGETAARALGDLEVVAFGEEPEGGVGDAALEVERFRQAQGAAQLLGVVGVRERGVLVEPLRRQHLGGLAPRAAPVLERDTHARVGLGRLGQRDGAEAEGQAQAHVALAQDHLADAEERRAQRRRLTGRAWPRCRGRA